MPIYEFHCPDCGRDFEELVLSSREKINCPGCGQGRCQKLMSASTFHTKGADGSTASHSAGGGCGSCHSSSCASCSGSC